MTSTSQPTICIVGAGPYGIAVATHLNHFGTNFRIFGTPIRRWVSQMPNQMLLKSEGLASSLYEPTNNCTLDHFYADEGLAYSTYGMPISRKLFAKYALSFQSKFVPNVEDVMVTSIATSPEFFELRLGSGEKLTASKVVIATGLDYMNYIPPVLADLPSSLRSHSADYFDLSHFKGKEVTVVGAGQSALETAAILHEEGASVTLIARAETLQWNSTPRVHRSLYERLRNPRSRLGDGRDLWIYDNAPWLFHHLPLRTRLTKVAKALGPAGAWWLKERVIGQISISLAHHIRSVEVRDGRVLLRTVDRDGRPQETASEHVIAATGYRFNVDNLPFFADDLKMRLQQEQQSPRLSSSFESSIPGLYFTGLSSTNSFGPSMRFLAGASYTARCIAPDIARA